MSIPLREIESTAVRQNNRAPGSSFYCARCGRNHHGLVICPRQFRWAKGLASEVSGPQERKVHS